jgi:single-stranded-DNA-specific exonuclease
MNFTWKAHDNLAFAEQIDFLSKSIKIDPLIAALLVRRGITTFDQAECFFRPKISQINDPFLFHQMTEAVDALNKAILEKQKIRLYGDYDVDGTTAVAIMVNVLGNKTDRLDYYIPDRYTEGYGLSQQGVDAAISDGVQLFITLDCGIRSVDLIQQLKDKGIQVMVCDHHEPGPELPQAILLDPKIPGAGYPFDGLSGAGVGMKLLEGLYRQNNWPNDELLAQWDLLALSIAADIVPVTNENRIYAFHGLKRLNHQPRLALNKMLTASNKKSPFVLSDLVFGVAPRINAAGRIRTGRTAVECMLDLSHTNLEDLLMAIEADNAMRKNLDQNITQHALELLKNEDPSRSVNILYDASWHKGVVGIVASRIMESSPLPTIILTEMEGVLSGSARTVMGFDIHEALTTCKELLIQFGGHQHAAGLSLKQEDFQEFKQKMNSLAATYFDTHSKQPELAYHAELDFHQIFENESTSSIPKLMRILGQFEPFGPDNPKPVFVTRGVYATHCRLLKDLHLKLTMQQPGCPISLQGIAFNSAEKEDYCAEGLSFDVAYTLDVNEFNQQRTVQLMVRDILPSPTNVV